MDMYVRPMQSQFIESDPEVKQRFVSSNGVPLTASQVSTSLWRTFQREGIVTEGRETDLGRRAVSKIVSLNYANIHQPQNEAERDKPAADKQWTAEETEQLRQLFKQDLKTGAIEEPKVKKILSTSHLKEEHSLKAVVLKLCRMREEDMKTRLPPCEEETCCGKVMKFLHSAPHQPPSPAHTSGSVSVESSGFWREFTEEQKDHLLSLTRDLIDNGAIKKEVVWQRVKSDERSLQLGLISGTGDEDEETKIKQRLTYKVCKMAKTLSKSKGKAK